MLFFVVFFVL